METSQEMTPEQFDQIVSSAIPDKLRPWVKLTPRSENAQGPATQARASSWLTESWLTESWRIQRGTPEPYVRDDTQRRAKEAALALATALEREAAKVREAVRLSEFNLAEEKWLARQAGYARFPLMAIEARTADNADSFGSEYVSNLPVTVTPSSAVAIASSFVKGWEDADRIHNRAELVKDEDRESARFRERVEEARQAGKDRASGVASGAVPNAGMFGSAEKWRKENTAGLTAAMNAELQTAYVQGWKSA